MLYRGKNLHDVDHTHIQSSCDAPCLPPPTGQAVGRSRQVTQWRTLVHAGHSSSKLAIGRLTPAVVNLFDFCTLSVLRERNPKKKTRKKPLHLHHRDRDASPNTNDAASRGISSLSLALARVRVRRNIPSACGGLPGLRLLADHKHRSTPYFASLMVFPQSPHNTRLLCQRLLLCTTWWYFVGARSIVK